jgi:tRNA threonylcarbamoyladenosine biosynthesis protein TsaB
MWLALETATDRASVAVGQTAGDAIEESLTGARRHAGALLPMVEAALRRRGIGLGGITGLVVGDGPGSFTGLRVGATAAKALARTRGLPLHSAPSLLARAAGVAGESNALVLALSDALRGEVYAGAFRFTPGSVVTELEPSVWHPEGLVALGLAPDLLVGEVPESARAMLERATGLAMIAPPDGAPRATALIALVSLAGGLREVTNASEWEPVYGRPAEAQARWEIAHGRPLPDPSSGAG